MPFCGEIGELVEIGSIRAEELSVGWRIRNVFSLSGGRNYFYTSPVFAIGDERWDLRIWPCWNRETQSLASGWMRLDVCRVDQGAPKTFRVGIGLRGSGGVVKSREVEELFFGLADYSCKDFCSRSELMEHNARLMPGGILTIMCILKRRGTDGGVENIMEGLDKLLITGEESVTVQVGDVEFSVQKAILSARSPILWAMFRRGTEEWASSRISIGDCEPEVFKQYLQYIHTGSVAVLSDQSAFSLYQVAVKYSADGLKQQCVQHMRSTRV